MDRQTCILLAVCFSIFLLIKATNGIQGDSLLRPSRQTNQRPNRPQSNNNNYDEFSGLDTNWNSNNNQFTQNQGSTNGPDNQWSNNGNNGQNSWNRPNNQWSTNGNNGQGVGNRPNNQWSNTGNNGQGVGNRPNNQWSNTGNNGQGIGNRPNNQWSNTGNNGQGIGNSPNNEWSNSNNEQGSNNQWSNNNQNQGTNENWSNSDNQSFGSGNQDQTTPVSSNQEGSTVSESLRNSCGTSCRTRVTYEYNPVCGSDNMVYQNSRYLECMRDCGIPTEQIYAGTCRNRP